MSEFFELGFLNLSWGSIVMLIIGGVLLYLGIAKKMEPLLLVPIGFGVILVNLFNVNVGYLARYRELDSLLCQF